MVRRLTSTTIVFWPLLAAALVEAGGPPDRVQVEPENVRIGIFYSGQTIRVKASTPAPREIVVRVAGPEGPLTVKKKGKKYGLWMNVGEVHYASVPSLYILRTSRALDKIATRQELCRLKLGFDALRDAIGESEDGARELFPELVKLKQKDGLFSCEEGCVQLVPIGSRAQEATAEFLLPPSAPMDDYTVEVFAFHDHQGELLGTAVVHLRRSSIVSSIASLAANHGLLYGCLAVLAAVLAGLFTGFIFSR